jgi:hypothetical protein
MAEFDELSNAVALYLEFGPFDDSYPYSEALYGASKDAQSQLVGEEAGGKKGLPAAVLGGIAEFLGGTLHDRMLDVVADDGDTLHDRMLDVVADDGVFPGCWLVLGAGRRINNRVLSGMLLMNGFGMTYQAERANLQILAEDAMAETDSTYIVGHTDETVQAASFRMVEPTVEAFFK